MNRKWMTKFYVFIVMVASSDLWANSSKLKSWGNNVVSEGQSIGASWVPAALVVVGGLSLMGFQMATGLLARIVLGAGILFGAGAIGGLLKGVFS